MAVMVLVLLLAATLAPVSSKTFLATQPEAPQHVHLLEELEELLGSEHREDVESRAKRLEEVMRPIFLSLPKDKSGGVGPEAVRFMLHRIFVDRHGWFVRGLAHTGDAWNSSSAMEALKDHVDSEHSRLLEARTSESVSLHHVAVLAATLESMVHAETLSRLRSAYRVAGLDTESEVSAARLRDAVDNYMLFYVAGIVNHTRASNKMVSKIFSKIEEAYPMWGETQAWAHQTVEESLSTQPSVSFEAATRAVEVVGDRYGRWQNKECLSLKSSLMEIEENGTGRVPLDVFYQGALDGQWQFSESVPYLRKLGAIDDSVPERPSVIIANYVNGPSNCVAASTFYSVCCIDECEALLGHLETHVAAPEASPEFIAELVSKLPSATVAAPRELPATMLQRLQEIADTNGGAVPLHGRLFAQWLHHAYPRECQYPHLSGTTKPMTAREWKAETGEGSTMSNEMMAQHIADIANATADDQKNIVEVPWTCEEELFISRPQDNQQQKTKNNSTLTAFRTFVAFTALFSMAVMLVRSLLTANDAVKPCMKSAKCMV
mmetsp:Transcript_45823/g.106478  ORF Transcript_45823/g.106478 Transcript_45823/m.106478 type:complete len:549 (-) Transcript_45823:65-1711(-)